MVEISKTEFHEAQALLLGLSRSLRAGVPPLKIPLPPSLRSSFFRPPMIAPDPREDQPAEISWDECERRFDINPQADALQVPPVRALSQARVGSKNKLPGRIVVGYVDNIG